MFALGDCSSFSGVDGRSLPTTAQVARQQAVFLARSLVGYLRQNSPLAEFHFRDMGSLVSLADYAAYGTLGSYGFFRGGFLRGHLAHLAHAALYRMHQMVARRAILKLATATVAGFTIAPLAWAANDKTPPKPENTLPPMLLLND